MGYLSKNKLVEFKLIICLLITSITHAQITTKAKLIMGSEQLSEFYNEMKSYDSLETIKIGFVDYSEIDFTLFKKLGNLKSLYFFNIKKICVEDFIEKVSFFRQVDSLSLNASNIRYLPSTLYKLNFLDYLDFTANKIKSIEEQQKQILITEINLSHNKLKSVEILGTSSIKILNLTYNPLKTFPYSLSNLSRLEVLQIGNYKKLKINRNIKGFVDLRWITYLIPSDNVNLAKDFFVDNQIVEISSLLW